MLELDPEDLAALGFGDLNARPNEAIERRTRPNARLGFNDGRSRAHTKQTLEARAWGMALARLRRRYGPLATLRQWKKAFALAKRERFGLEIRGLDLLVHVGGCSFLIDPIGRVISSEIKTTDRK